MTSDESTLLHEIYSKLDVMTGSLFGQPGVDGFLRTTKEDIQNHENRLNAHSNRLSSLDKWKWTISGGLTVIVFLVAHHMLTGIK